LQRCWHLVDANGQTTGRLASQVANILRGKHKPTFLFNKDMGDYVVVVNAEKVRNEQSGARRRSGERPSECVAVNICTSHF
jgi:ribosomal protein L13